MKKLVQSFLGMTLLLLCNSVFSATTTIIGTDIKGLHQADGKGEYDQIINKTLVSKGLATLKILPPARAESEFIACSNCCWSPANLNKEFYSFNFEPKVTEPMGVAKIYIFTAPGKPVLDNLESLKGLKVGIVHGMPYGKSFDSAKLGTLSAPTIEKNIELLEKGRIDAFVAYVPDAYLVFDQLKKEKFPHAIDKPLVTHPDSLICKGVDDSFIQTFNAGLK